jgi:hypothetical protein
MTAFVVDTNVAIVANNKEAPQADIQCVLACIRKLKSLLQKRVCLDSGDHILAEYRNNLSLSGQPGVGDEFMRWLHDNQYNDLVCERVDIRENSERGYEEFPDNAELKGFDRSDRKFVAVALTSQHNPTILNAVDPDWIQHQVSLRTCGVMVEELCPGCLKKSCDSEK